MIIRLEDHYFSATLKWTVLIGSVLAGGYLIFTGNHEWVVLILVVLSLVLFSTHYLLEIDTEKKVIHDSFYLLWIRTHSEEFRFSTLNCIRLDKERHTYTANSRARDHQTDFNEYIGTLEYDQGKSVELMRNEDYQPIAEELKKLASQLSVPLERTF
jgi:hypothetical protein